MSDFTDFKSFLKADLEKYYMGLSGSESNKRALTREYLLEYTYSYFIDKTEEYNREFNVATKEVYDDVILELGFK